MDPHLSENGWREWRGEVNTRLHSMEELLKEVREDLKPLRGEVVRLAAVVAIIVAAIGFAATQLVSLAK